MDENKVTVTREEFDKLVANEIMEMAEGEGALGFILSGAVVCGVLCEKVFGDNETVCITKEEFCDLTASAISEFTKDEKAKDIATPVGLLAILISGRIKNKLFSEERLEKERMLQVAKMLVGENEEVKTRSGRVIEFLKIRFPKGIQMFNTRNIAGDTMDTIYDEDGVTVDYCRGYDYIEIFGLTYEEFEIVASRVNKKGGKIKYGSRCISIRTVWNRQVLQYEKF